MDIQSELIKRYNYLYENKELILAECIVYEIDKEKIEKEIKRMKKLLKRIDKIDDIYKLANDLMKAYNKDLKTKKPYLMKEQPKEYVDMIEEITLGDKEIEETELYKRIEYIKNNSVLTYQFNKKINDLEVRRNKNEHLKKIPTFTVWKILSYVRKRYETNSIVSKALDKYYNIDRYVIANDDCMFGYYVPEEIPKYNYPDSALYGCFDGEFVAYAYKANSYEEEDSYKELMYSIELTDNYYPSKFANALANSNYIINKKENIKIKSLNKRSR